jgi:sugar transferase (PEP-CTERM/EpsH1 system associated)
MQRPGCQRGRNVLLYYGLTTTGASLRILIIASEVPYPPTDANRAVVYNLLRHFRNKHDVTMLAMTSGDKDEDVAVIRSLVEELALVEHEISKTPTRRLSSMLTIWPFGVLLYRSKDFAVALEKLLRRKNFDVIIGGHINMAQYTVEVEHTPKIIAPLDAVSLYYKRQLGLTLNPAAFVYCLLQYWKVRRYERRTYSRYDACVLVARRDAEVIRELCPGLPIYFAPSGTDIPATEKGEELPYAIGFSGVMDYPPNVDAAAHFAHDIFPLVRKHVPEATFHVVGKDPSAEVRALGRRDGVVVTGTVPDVKEYLKRVQVFVCPMRLGAGMKMKIIEAMAVALPVVSTTRGAEGMDFVAGRDFIAADEAEDFAAAVVRLLKDKRLREEYGRWGRLAVERNYTWGAHARAWDEIITSVAALKKY